MSNSEETSAATTHALSADESGSFNLHSHQRDTNCD